MIHPTEKVFHYLLIVKDFFIVLSEYGLILNQELNLMKASQWQKDENKMGDGILETERYLSTLHIGLMMYGRAR